MESYLFCIGQVSNPQLQPVRRILRDANILPLIKTIDREDYEAAIADIEWDLDRLAGRVAYFQQLASQSDSYLAFRHTRSLRELDDSDFELALSSGTVAVAVKEEEDEEELELLKEYLARNSNRRLDALIASIRRQFEQLLDITIVPGRPEYSDQVSLVFSPAVSVQIKALAMLEQCFRGTTELASREEIFGNPDFWKENRIKTRLRAYAIDWRSWFK